MLKAKGVPERRISVLIGISRSSMRYQTHPRTPSSFRTRVRELASEHPRYGYRRVHVLLGREQIKVNVKTVHRVWKEEKLMVKPSRKRKRVRGDSGVPQAATGPNHVPRGDASRGPSGGPTTSCSMRR